MTSKILVSDPLSEEGIEILKSSGFPVDVKPGLSEDELCAIIGDYDCLIIRSGTKVTPKVIEAGKNLKVIGRAGVGVDNIDVPCATDKGILVMNSISSANHPHTPKWQNAFWGVLMAVITMMLIYAGGLKSLQTMTLISALPFGLIMFVLSLCLFKALRADELYNSAHLPYGSRNWGGERWQQRLRQIVTFHQKGDIKRFFQEKVVPAFEELREEFAACGIRAEIPGCPDQSGLIFHLNRDNSLIRIDFLHVGAKSQKCALIRRQRLPAGVLPAEYQGTRVRKQEQKKKYRAKIPQLLSSRGKLHPVDPSCFPKSFHPHTPPPGPEGPAVSFYAGREEGMQEEQVNNKLNFRTPLLVFHISDSWILLWHTTFFLLPSDERHPPDNPPLYIR